MLMELLGCLVGLTAIAIFIGGVIGFGRFVLKPLGEISRTRVMTARFSLLDLLWLMLLLQPSLAAFGVMVRDRFGGYPERWLGIFILIWVGTVAAWYVMTGSLAKAGVTHVGRRAAAVLIILPMICVVIPVAALCQAILFGSFFDLPWRNVEAEFIFSCIAAELAFVAALFACRWLSRWIASGIPAQESPTD